MPEHLEPKMMSHQDRLVLEKAGPELIESMNLESSVLLAELVKWKVITSNDSKDIRAEKGIQKKYLLIEILQQGKGDTIDMLILSLDNSKQPHVAGYLRRIRKEVEANLKAVADQTAGCVAMKTTGNCETASYSTPDFPRPVADGSNQEATQVATTSSAKAGGAKQMECLRELPEGLLYRFSVLYDEKDDVVSVPFAEHLTEELKASGWTPGYCASNDRIPGSRIISANMNMIQYSQFVICVLAETFLRSDWNTFFNEASFGDVLNDTKNKGYRCVIPIMLHDNRQTIEELVSRNARHLTIIERLYVGVGSFEDRDHEFDRTVEKIKRTMGEYSQRYRPPHQDNVEAITEEGVSVEENDSEVNAEASSSLSPASGPRSSSAVREPSLSSQQLQSSPKVQKENWMKKQMKETFADGILSLVISQAFDYLAG